MTAKGFYCKKCGKSIDNADREAKIKHRKSCEGK